MKKITLILVALVLVAGCEDVQKIDTTNDSSAKQVMSLDYRDFDQAASDMIQSLLKSGTLVKGDGSKYVMYTGVITNDTMQRIDTDQLSAKIEQDITNSGLVIMTSAVGGKDSNRDDTVYGMRDVRDSSRGQEYQQDTLPQKGQIISPELGLTGKIFQRNLRYDKKRQQVEYYFQLKVTNIKTGLRIWQNEVLIGKRGTNNTVSW